MKIVSTKTGSQQTRDLCLIHKPDSSAFVDWVYVAFFYFSHLFFFFNLIA